MIFQPRSVEIGRISAILSDDWSDAETAGRVYTEEPKAWLATIRDHLAVNLEMLPEDLMDALDFAARCGRLRARPSALLDELTGTLVA